MKYQKGSTLLFVAMMVSFLMVMALSVAQVIIFEVKMGGDFASGQKAFYSKQGAFELSFLNKANISGSLVNGSQIFSTITNPNIGLYIFNSRGLSSIIRREADRIFVKPKIEASYLKAYALRSDGSLWVVGFDQYCDFGLGCHGWARRKWTYTMNDVIDVAAGFNHMVALKSDGTVWTVGDNWDGQLGTGDTSNRENWYKTPMEDVVQIATGEMSTLVLKKDGSVWGVGENWSGQLGIGSSGNNQTIWQRARISSSEYLENVIHLGGSQLTLHSVAVRSDGVLFMSGNNSDGQFGIGNKNNSSYFIPVKTNIRKVHIGYYHSLALDFSGQVWGAGDNSWGLLGLGSLNEQIIWAPIKQNISDIKTGYAYSLLLDNNNRVWGAGCGWCIGVGDDKNVFIDVGLDDIISLSGGGWNSSYALGKDGYYFATGGNRDYELGFGESDNTDRDYWELNPNFKL